MRKPEGKTITSCIADVLGREIVAGIYAPGSAIPVEDDVCVRFSASRSAVREAIKILAAKGLLFTGPRRGSRICETKDWNLLDPLVLSWISESAPSRHLIVELAEVRLAFECEAAALAAERQIPDRLAQIRAAFEQMQYAARGNEYAVALDAAFHEAILAAAGNRVFETLSALVRTAVRFTLPKARPVRRVSISDLSAHEMILVAIEEGLPLEARSAMRAMLEADLTQARAGLPENRKRLLANPTLPVTGGQA
jgi:DNA-binding FadR family transcriptional regulator